MPASATRARAIAGKIMGHKAPVPHLAPPPVGLPRRVIVGRPRMAAGHRVTAVNAPASTGPDNASYTVASTFDTVPMADQNGRIPVTVGRERDPGGEPRLVRDLLGHGQRGWHPVRGRGRRRVLRPVHDHLVPAALQIADRSDAQARPLSQLKLRQPGQPTAAAHLRAESLAILIAHARNLRRPRR